MSGWQRNGSFELTPAKAQTSIPRVVRMEDRPLSDDLRHSRHDDAEGLMQGRHA